MRMKTKEGRRLDAVVAARIGFLKKVTDFAKMVTRERGEELEHTFHDSFIHTVRELKDFAGFSFHVDIGQTMFGGNSVKITYHRQGQLAVPVLDISWETHIEHCSHMRFNSNQEWQKEIMEVIRRWKSIGTNIDQATAHAAMQNETKRQTKMNPCRACDSREETQYVGRL